MSEISESSGIDLHLRYIGITPEDMALLRKLRPIVEKRADEFVDKFYVHLRAFEGTRRFLSDESVTARLLRGQRAYLLSIFDATFGEEYYQFRRFIGQTHFRIGLDFQWYIGAYVLYFDHLLPILEEHYAHDYRQCAAAESALRKALLLDMSIVLEAYHEGDKAALETSQKQVFHQEKLAAIGLLSSGLAHEIGNPLASILAICDNQIRKSAGVDPHIIERFQRIRDQVSRIVNIVRQLVAFARPGISNWQSVHIHELIEGALTIARLSRSAKHVEVRTKFDPAVPAVFLLGDQLSQVFLNLLLNAIDALQDEGGAIDIHTTLKDGFIRVQVEDNGCGIAPENLPKLFAPFFTTKDVGKGTGLGLYVSHGIISRHGGRIDVSSKPGMGTAFTVDIPVRLTPPVSDSTSHPNRQRDKP